MQTTNISVSDSASQHIDLKKITGKLKKNRPEYNAAVA